MPVCLITVSECVSRLTDALLSKFRDIVATGLNSKSRYIDSSHIAIRVQSGSRAYMLGDIELEIYSQIYLRRLFSRDKRANYISKCVSDCIGRSCATWINMGFVGYSRVTTEGNAYYSDSENPFIRFMQKARGIYTNEKGTTEKKPKNQ